MRLGPMERFADIVTNGIQQHQYRAALWIFQALTAVAVIAAIALSGLPSTMAQGTALALIFGQFVVCKLLGANSELQIAEREALLVESSASRQQVEELFAMTDMLQSADSHHDAGAVLEATTRKLLPDFSGALYVFNNSRDRLDLATSWAADDRFKPTEALVPANCWALKRGKSHVNDTLAGSLACLHHASDVATIEVPMVARGTIHGLIMLGCPEGTDGKQALRDISRVARALADSMSLALSNIALREKLRTQSLRDPLTGLYNRRYMEDALERYLSIGERGGTPTSVVMIDLDHFKQLNDKHGHAKGDAMLREVAGQIVGALRPSDVVSRYGGEEILVILPSCEHDDALVKAEMLRARIEALSETHGAEVSASFGVATVPDMAASASDVVARADAALYAAKMAGRNCVISAAPRETSEKPAPRLAVG